MTQTTVFEGFIAFSSVNLSNARWNFFFRHIHLTRISYVFMDYVTGHMYKLFSNHKMGVAPFQSFSCATIDQKKEKEKKSRRYQSQRFEVKRKLCTDIARCIQSEEMIHVSHTFNSELRKKETFYRSVSWPQIFTEHNFLRTEWQMREMWSTKCIRLTNCKWPQLRRTTGNWHIDDDYEDNMPH